MQPCQKYEYFVPPTHGFQCAIRRSGNQIVWRNRYYFFKNFGMFFCQKQADISTVAKPDDVRFAYAEPLAEADYIIAELVDGILRVVGNALPVPPAINGVGVKALEML
jgi:hypothetical protein